MALRIVNFIFISLILAVLRLGTSGLVRGKTSVSKVVRENSVPWIVLTESKHSTQFDYLLLAQFWPGTSCMYFGKECHIPDSVKGFTIHGLWPSHSSKAGPSFCNESTPFDYRQIESLESELDAQWPYMKEGNKTYLWEHEWDKHGRCAYLIPELRGELQYFSQTLSIHVQLSTEKVLEKAGIIPSNVTKYRVGDISQALEDAYGTTVSITCFPGYNEGSSPRKEFCNESSDCLDEIWICFDKELKPMNCPPPVPQERKRPTWQRSHYLGCHDGGNTKVFYLPYKPTSRSHL